MQFQIILHLLVRFTTVLFKPVFQKQSEFYTSRFSQETFEVAEHILAIVEDIGELMSWLRY